MVEVFVAFRGGVAHALPEFEDQMIETLGAEPAETVVGCEPAFTRMDSHTTAYLVARSYGGSSVADGFSQPYSESERDRGRYPKRSWKRYRREQYRAA